MHVMVLPEQISSELVKVTERLSVYGGVNWLYVYAFYDAAKIRLVGMLLRKL